MDLRLKIEELGLEERTQNALLREGIRDISGLQLSGEITGIGKTGWKDIADRLAYYLCSIEFHIAKEKARRYDEIVKIVTPNDQNQGSR